MAEYIDKNRLILSMNDWMLQNAPVKAGDDTIRADTILDAIKMVEDSPAADVRENVKAEWIRKISNYVMCSICGYERKMELSLQRGWIIPKFCEDCGAQMGGAEDG